MSDKKSETDKDKLNAFLEKGKLKNKDCHNCLRPDKGQQCPMAPTLTSKCLNNDERPYWVGKEQVTNLPSHDKNCDCPECIKYWQRHSVEPDRVILNEAREKEAAEISAYRERLNKDVSNVTLGGPDSYGAKIIQERMEQDRQLYELPDQDIQVTQADLDKAVADYIHSNHDNSQYTTESPVFKQSARIDELISAHWAYQEKLLSAGQDKTQTFTWDQVMEMRRWDYCSSAKHFYGHGYEDATKDQTSSQPGGGMEW